MEKKTNYKLFAISTVMLVLCIDIPIDACLGLTTSDETSLSDIESSLKSDIDWKSEILIIDGSKNITDAFSSQELRTIEDTINSGGLVIIDNAVDLSNMSSIKCVYDSESEYSALFKDEMGVTHCMSTDCPISDLSNEISEWIEQMYASTYDNVPVATLTESIIRDNIGKLIVSCFYYYIGTNGDYDYYVVEYRIQTTTLSSDSKNSMHHVQYQMDSVYSYMNLLDVKPDPTHSMQSTNVGVSFSLSGGVGVNFGWTFTTPVCQIYNDSDVSTEEVNIKFDMKCNETNTTEITRPGCFVEIVAGEHYESEEHFIAEFRIPYYQRFWPWDPEYSWLTTSLTIHPCLT